MTTTPDDNIQELSARVREQLTRLGAVRHAPHPLPKEEAGQAFPPAYLELLTEWTWPEEAEYVGPDEEDDDWEERVSEDPGVETFTDRVFGAWSVNLGDPEQMGTWAFSLYEDAFGDRIKLVNPNRRWLQIGITDGGNYAVLLELDDANPGDPGVHIVDHELIPQSLWGEEYMDDVLPLSMFLNYLKPNAPGEDAEDDE